MLHLLRDHHRAEVRKRPFPPEWEAFVRENVAHYRVLNDAERAELCAPALFARHVLAGLVATGTSSLPPA